MGVSIWLRAGTIATPKGKEKSITPGWRSKAVDILSSRYGESPWEFGLDDLCDFENKALGASLYTLDKDNFWGLIATEIEENGVVTVGTEY